MLAHNKQDITTSSQIGFSPLPEFESLFTNSRKLKIGAKTPMFNFSGE
jgi:hypothetical protein